MIVVDGEAIIQMVKDISVVTHVNIPIYARLTIISV